MPFGYLFPGKAWRPGSLKYGKVRIFSLATSHLCSPINMLLLNFLITGKVSPHLIIGQRHKGQTCLHWVHLILLPSPHCEHKMISVWVPPDDWTSCLSPEEVSLPPPGTVSTCQDLTAILSVLTFPTPSSPLVDIWYIPGQLDTTPHSPTLPFNCYVLNYMGKATIC